MNDLKEIRMNKTRIIREYLAKWSHLPAQGTAAWLAGRPTTIGGSELYDVIHSKKGLIKRKLGFTPNISNFNTLFGHVFEGVTRALCQLHFRCIIFEGPGSIPSAECADKTYSMDGIGVVEFADGAKITLFEFKNVVTRQIKPGEIPKKYIPQVKSGLCDIEIAERALYVETQTIITGPEYAPNAIATGFLAVYAERDPAIDFLNVDMHTLNKHDMTQVMSRIYAGEFQTWLSPISYAHYKPDLNAAAAEFQKYCESSKKTFVGFIHFAVLNMNAVQVEPEPGYTRAYAQAIKEVVDEVKGFLALPENERMHAYMERYNVDELSKMMEMMNMDL